MKLNDTELIQGCQRRDPVYEGLLVEKYAALLMTVSRRYSRTHQEAEDVLQDAFIKILENIQQYNPERGTLQSWMRSIVIRTALRDYHKKYPAAADLETVGDLQVAKEVNILDKLAEEELLRIIAQLPEGYRQVFNLYVIDGFSHKEIATILNITESTSRSQLTRAKNMLKKKLIRHQKNPICNTTVLTIALGLN